MIRDLVRFRFSLRRNLPLAFWAASLLLLFLAAAWPHQPAARRELIVIRDRSGSIERGGPVPPPDWLIAEAEAADHTVVIETAGEARIVPGDADRLDAFEPAAPDLEPGQTRLAAALRLAGGLPRATATRRRVLLVSDGLETDGDAASEARRLAPHLLVETIGVGEVVRPDARAVRLAAPGTVQAGTRFAVSVFVETTEPATVSIRLDGQASDNTTQTHRKTARITPAGATLAFPVTADRPGLMRWRATVVQSGDRVPENDIALAATWVRGDRRVLWVGAPPPAGLTSPALTPVAPAALPLAQLHAYACIALHDVPSSALPAGAVRALEAAVRDGTGLVVFGGPHSLGPGGDHRSEGSEPPLASLLPVRVVPRRSLAVVFAIDTSGSMSETAADAGGAKKISLAAAALLRAWNALQEGDRGAVIAFARTARTVLPFTAKEAAGSDRTTAAVERLRADLRAGGGTSLFAGIEYAVEQLQGVRAHRRQIVLLTDGTTVEKEEERRAAIETTTDLLRERGVGVSAIAVGEAPDRALLQTLTGGQSQFVHGRTVLLPAVLLDTLEQARDYDRRDGTIGAVAAHETVRGLRPDVLPPAARYIATGPLRADGDAVALLESIRGEPLAAAWSRGLGRVAVTAGRPWREWGWSERGAALGRRLLDWAGAHGDKGELQARTDRGRLRVSYAEDGGSEQTMTPLTAHLDRIDASEDGAGATPPRTLSLLPHAPGLWEGEAALPAAGLYRLTVASPQTGTQRARRPFRLDRRDEWLRFGIDGMALARIAAAGGGGVVYQRAQLRPWDAVPVHGPPPRRSASPWLLAAGGLLFLLGLAASAWR